MQDSVEGQTPRSASEWLEQGLELIQAKLYRDAIGSFDFALVLDQSLAKAWCNRGQAFLELQQHEKAIDSYERALHLECRNCSSGWLSKGRALQSLGRHLEAISCFDEALKLRPDFWQALQNKSFSLLLLDQDKEALRICNQAIQIQPNFADLYLNRGIALHGLQNYEAALRDYDKALSFNQTQPKIWYNQGCTFTQLKRYQDASASYSKAIQLAQDQYWLAWQGLGQAMVQLKGYKAAHDIWLQGIQKLLLYQNNHSHLLGCAELYYTKGEAYNLEAKQQENPLPYWRSAQQCYGKALEYFEQNLKREPSNLYLQEQYLFTLQEYINVRRYIGISVEKLRKLLRDGTDKLRILLNDQGLSGAKKLELTLKFIIFDQLTVDCLVHSNQIKQSLEAAEQDKNACLTWMLHGWSDKDLIPSPNYSQIQTLLTPTTAIVIGTTAPLPSPPLS